MKNKIRRLIMGVVILLAVLCIIFIFGNSMKDGTESGEQSMAVKKMLIAVAGIFGIDGNIDHALLRNLAHVAEFALLGACVGLIAFYLARRKYPVTALRYSAFISASVGAGIIIAIVDELIQLTSPGRACELKDALLDITGVIIGNIFAILCYLAVVYLNRYLKNRREEKIAKNY